MFFYSILAYKHYFLYKKIIQPSCKAILVHSWIRKVQYEKNLNLVEGTWIVETGDHSWKNLKMSKTKTNKKKEEE